MQDDDAMDGLITQHALFKILDNDIIPCSCGGCRKVVQKPESESLITQCSKCHAREPFNISDLAIIGGALLKLAIAGKNYFDFKAPGVTREQIFQMIEDFQDHEVWVKEIESQTFRKTLKVLKGGLSK